MWTKPKDEFGRDTDHWSQGKDKVKDLINTEKTPKK